MWESLKKATGGLLSDETKAKAAAFAQRAHEAAQAGVTAAVEKSVKAHAHWQESRRQAEEARRLAEGAEAERQRALADEHGLPCPLTYELKMMLGIEPAPLEHGNRKTAAEDQPPGEWFAPMGRPMRVPAWLNASHPFFTGQEPARILETATMNNGGRSWAIWQLRPRYTLHAATWYFESLIIRTLFERWKRGLPVMGEDNRLFMPSVTEDGYPIIDASEDEDGTVRALVAMPCADICNGEDRDAFLKLLGRYVFTPWKDKYTKHMIQPPGAGFRREWPLTDYSVGRPRVVPRVLVQADPNRNPYAPRSTVHGSAQWAWRDRLAAGGFINPAEPEAICGHTFLGRSHYTAPNGEVLMNHLTCFGGDGHRLIVGPPGSGKFTSAIAPLLLWSANRDSAFVLDVKNGEATAVTGEHRASLGPVTVLDPFAITDVPSGAINPIDLLREDNPRLVATAERIAEAIFLPSNSSDEHWDFAAKKTLTALLMHIGTSPAFDGERNLKTLRNIVREQIPAWVLETMLVNEAGDGEIAAEARALIAAEESGSDKYRFSVMASLGVNIGFLKVPEILAATERTTFDPRELKERVSTLYVVVPDHQLGAVTRWVRLIYTYVMEQLREGGGPPADYRSRARGAPGGGDAAADLSVDSADGSDGAEDKPAARPCGVHVVLDEFPSLGKFERVAQDMAQTRSLGVHMHVVVQTFQQLLDTYGKGWERFQGTSAVTHVLGVRDNFTADQVSKMLGTTTVKTSNESRTRGNSGGSQSEGTNYAARALVTPDELLAMPAERCLAVVGGMNPVRLEKVAYF